MKLPAASCGESKQKPPPLLQASAYINSAHDIKPDSTTPRDAARDLRFASNGGQDSAASCTAAQLGFAFSAVALPLSREATENGKAKKGINPSKMRVGRNLMRVVVPPR
jgi:hypothetical protein